jgi:hypothetical protein
LKLEADTALASNFHKFLWSKNRKLTDYETIDLYRFAIDVKDKWFERRLAIGVCNFSFGSSSLKLSQGNEVLMRMKHILEVLRYLAGWFTQATQVLNLVKDLNEDQIEDLKDFSRGGRALIQHLQLLTLENSR